jgi:hypothetical protein
VRRLNRLPRRRCDYHPPRDLRATVRKPLPARRPAVKRPPVLKRIAQIGLVVRNAQVTARRYWDQFGIGPWRLKTLNPANVADMVIRGRRVDHAMRIGIAAVGDIEWEIIEPLDDQSIYAEHLRVHGEGLHHILFDVENYAEALAHFLQSGTPELASGQWHGYRYAYFDTRGSLGCISEICSLPAIPTELPAPDSTYP